MSASQPETPSDTAEPSETAEPRDPLKRNIALTLASLVVLGAGIAILQVDAGANESNTARQTTRVAVKALRANVVADTVAGLQPVLAAERDFMAFRRPLTSGQPTLGEAAGLPSGSQVAGSLRVAQASVPDLAVGRLLPTLQTEAQRLTLQQRALATTRITWNDRSTQYTTVIAVLAVAIFLVGFGLVVAGPIRPAAYGLGVAVGIFAAAWTVWIYHLPIPTTPPAAIQAAARGAVLSTNGDYRGALAAYDRSLAVDDRLGPAYSGRARARLLAANPDYATTRAVTDTSTRTFGQAELDAKRALELNSRDILGTALVAVMSFYDGHYDDAIAASDEAIGINPKVPDLWLLKSAAQLANGDRSGATASLNRARALIRGSGPSQRTRLLASSYLSYLAWVERHVPLQAGAARQLATRVVSIETAFTLGRTLPARPPRHGVVSVHNLRFADDKLQLELRWTRMPAGTALSGIGYERPLPQGAWTQPASLALFATVTGSGRRDISVPLQRACKPTRVRVDVYLNGSPAVSQTGPGVPATC